MDSATTVTTHIEDLIFIKKVKNEAILMQEKIKSKLNSNDKMKFNKSEISEALSNIKEFDGKTLDILRFILESKNVETKMHMDRVANYCIEMARALNLNENMIKKAGLVGQLHDIGKISIEDSILLKPAKLTYEEYEIMKTHSEKGYSIASMLPEISCVSREILTHHEKWDGTGYPLGLKGEEIPVLSRIVAIADSFDAMTEDRCYSKGRSVDDAVMEIQRCSGTQFDPELVEVFIDIIDKIKGVMTA